MQYYVGVDQFCFLVAKITKTKKLVAFEDISWRADKPQLGNFLVEAVFFTLILLK